MITVLKYQNTNDDNKQNNRTDQTRVKLERRQPARTHDQARGSWTRQTTATSPSHGQAQGSSSSPSLFYNQKQDPTKKKKKKLPQSQLEFYSHMHHQMVNKKDPLH